MGSLTVVCFYLIVQMVGAGQLIKLLFGLDYATAVIVVGVLMVVYVTFGGMIATTWVQIIKARLLLAGGIVLLIMTMSQFGFSLETMAAKAVATHKDGMKIVGPGSLLADPVSAVSMSLGLVFGTAGLPHILMRFFTVPNAGGSACRCLSPAALSACSSWWCAPWAWRRFPSSAATRSSLKAARWAAS